MNTECNYCCEMKSTSEFIKSSGLKCRSCRADYQRAYKDLQREKAGKVKRVKKEITITPEQIAKSEKRVESYNARKEHYRYLGKVARNNLSNVRKSGNRLRDFEFYVMDSACEPKYHLGFIELKDEPIESLEIDQYYFEEESVINQCLRLADEFLKGEKKFRRLSQYERKIGG